MRITVGEDEYTSEPIRKDQPISGMTQVLKVNGKIIAAAVNDKMAEVVLLTMKRMWLAQAISKENPELLTLALDILTSLEPNKRKAELHGVVTTKKRRPPRKQRKTSKRK